ncbi:MAG: nuclease-related domain-containing protein [Luteolibacter sp.]
MLHCTLPLAFLSNWPDLVAAVGLFIIVKLVDSSTVKGWLGKTFVIRTALAKLDSTLYHHFRDLYLPHPDGKGTTKIDHVIVSPFGIFVIETKNHRGWIYGSEKQRQWTERINQHNGTFQNPLRQSDLHVHALVNFLGLPANRFHPLVFFIGGAKFRTPMPDNVLNRGLLPWIENQSRRLLGPAAQQLAVTRLNELKHTTKEQHASRHQRDELKIGNFG